MKTSLSTRQCLGFAIVALPGIVVPCLALDSNPAQKEVGKPAPITVHVLNTMTGKPATKLAVVLARKEKTGWKELAHGQTNESGRIASLLGPKTPLIAGVYRITYDTGGYFSRQNVKTFYPEVQVTFEVVDPDAHYHLPLILSPHGYSTYRGS